MLVAFVAVSAVVIAAWVVLTIYAVNEIRKASKIGDKNSAWFFGIATLAINMAFPLILERVIGIPVLTFVVDFFARVF